MPKYLSRKGLEQKEARELAPYAVFSSKSGGRKFSEKNDDTRTVFQRDRDRIIHSKAFRRLRGKTQVFVASFGDHFRDRLTHSLEVSQVARDMARNLRLNEDLAETLALAHDLGHTPFGHAGEYALDEIMKKFGKRFEHNLQSKRIVEKLEKQFPPFSGLNLTLEVRQGLQKHQTVYDQNNKIIVGKTLEAQVVDVADEIAYHNHDLDDGLRSRLFTFNDLSRISLWKEASKKVAKKYRGKLPQAVQKRRIVSALISMMIHNALETACRNIKNMRIKTFSDVMETEKPIVGFSPAFKKRVEQLRRFLWRKMYQSRQVLLHSRRGQKIIKDLFWHYYKHPKLMPKRFCARIEAPPDNESLEIIVKDYVAGMTDHFAIKVWKKLH